MIERQSIVGKNKIITRCENGYKTERCYDNENNLYRETIYCLGVIDSEKLYYKDGAIKIENHYLQGVKQGVEKWYWPDGTIKCKIMYVAGRREKVRMWDQSENIVYEELFVCGKKVQRYWKDSQLDKEIEYNNHDKVEKYYEDGKLKCELYYVVFMDRVHHVRLYEYNGEPRDVYTGLRDDIPLEYFKHPELIPIINNKIMDNNILKRLIYVELMGNYRLLAKTTHKIIHEEGEYSLLRIKLNFRDPIVLVKVKCSTTGIYYLIRVPPRIKTCQQGIAWSFSMPEHMYKLSQET